MSELIVLGGRELKGDIRVHGAKNAVLPILAATVLSGKESIIHDCPALSDVEASLEILRCLGCTATREGSTIIVNSSNIVTESIPECLMREMRSSVIFLGAIASRCKKARVTLPGGCELGPRPIDLHLKALRQLGMVIDESGGIIDCEAENVHNADIHLDFPSVGATENIMLAAATIPGITTISNAAKEPEIEDLQKFLNAIGAKVKGAGTSVISIEGVKTFNDAEHTIIADRIVAATYLCSAMTAGGKIMVSNIAPEYMLATISVLRDCGAQMYIGNNSIILKAPKRPHRINLVRTYPHPGFPTDAQAIFMSVFTIADGTSVIKETIFENRYKHVGELIRMNADITVDGRVAVIRGVKELSGAKVSAMDLRGGAALAVAALAAKGESIIENISHVDRGYEQLEIALSSLGADIKRKD